MTAPGPGARDRRPAVPPPTRPAARDDRDQWPPGDGGTVQILGCAFALPGAIVGTVLGLVIGYVTDDQDLASMDNPWILLATPVLAWGLGLAIAFGWDAALVRLTRLGRRLERWRGLGQNMTAVLAAVAPVVVAISFLLVWPQWIVPATVALGVIAYAPVVARWAWEIVR